MRLGMRRAVAATLLLTFFSTNWSLQTEAAEKSLAGKLLVAAPAMGDPNFTGTVIYMVQHDKSGAMGLVINKKMGEGPVADLLRGLDQPTEGVKGDIRIHYGGPVALKQGFVLHTTDYTSGSSIIVNKHVTLSSDPTILLDIGLGRGPKQALFAFGYAGWAPGQLEGELMRKDWVTVVADPSFIFEEDDKNKWEKAIALEELKL